MWQIEKTNKIRRKRGRNTRTRRSTDRCVGGGGEGREKNKRIKGTGKEVRIMNELNKEKSANVVSSHARACGSASPGG